MKPDQLKAGVRHLRAQDPALGETIRRVGPPDLKPRPTPDLFSALAKAIVYQQLSGKAASTILGRVQALFPQGDLDAAHLPKLQDAALRGAGLSGNKLLALRDLAAKHAEGVLPPRKGIHRLSDEEIIERLTQVRGIGVWTVQMLLLFNLGRPDVMPSTDLGIRKGFQKVYKKRSLPEPLHIERHSERWRPYRSLASWYLWRSLDS